MRKEYKVKSAEIKECVIEYDPTPSIGYIHEKQSYLLFGDLAMLYKWILWSYRKDENQVEKADREFWDLFGHRLIKENEELEREVTAKLNFWPSRAEIETAA